MTVNIQKINPILLVIIAILIPANSVLMNYLFTINFFSQIDVATNHLIQSTLVANLSSIAIFSVLIFSIGKLNLASMLISKSKAKTGLKWIFIIWFTAQLLSILISYLSVGNIVLSTDLVRLTGSFLAQLFGNAPFEEMIFRGLFFLQLYLILSAKMSNKRAVIYSMTGSQLLFALIHIPNRLLINQVDNLVLDLLAIFLVGIVFVLIYIKTNNLVFVIGIHALINIPFNITNSSFQVEIAIISLAIVITIFWNKLTANKNVHNLWYDGIED